MSSPLLLLLALPCTSALRYLVLRHGQTNHNRDGIIQGSSDVSVLTDAGVAQAQAAGAALPLNPGCTRLVGTDLIGSASIGRGQV